MFFLIVLLQGTAADSTDANFSTRQDVTASTAFTNCRFVDCESSSSGAAIHVSGSAIVLNITRCVFERCGGASIGGAICTEACKSFFLSDSSGSLCHSTTTGSFCYTHIATSVSGVLETRQTSVAACWGGQNTLEFTCDAYSSGSTTVLESLNSSLHQVTSHGSGLFVAQHYGLIIQFCTLSSNVPTNCVYFYQYIRTTAVECIGMINNTCVSSNGRGLICVVPTMNMTNCIFLNNTFDYFIGGYSAASTSNTVTLTRCVVDFQTFTRTRSVTVRTASVTYVPGAPLQVQAGDCPWPDPTPTPTVNPTATSTVNPTATPTESQSRLATSTQGEVTSSTASFTQDLGWLMDRRRIVYPIGLFVILLAADD